MLRQAATVLWSLQTTQEQSRRETFSLNGQGLDTNDAKNFVGRICRELSENHRIPSGGECMVLAQYLPKYAGQLVRFLNIS